MVRNSVLCLICLFVGVLQGCSGLKRGDALLIKESQSQSQSQDSAKVSPLQLCVQNAEALSKMDNKFKNELTGLYSLISNAKLYSSVSEKTSENVNSTIEPLFEYKINVMCNNISQKLINEFESKANVNEQK